MPAVEVVCQNFLRVQTGTASRNIENRINTYRMHAFSVVRNSRASYLPRSRNRFGSPEGA
jgi:hypothetical protein